MTPGPLRVFLLDDHELMRRGVRDLLNAAPGITVVGEAGTAREGTARILELRPDVALLDFQLPDGSGITVCREVRSRNEAIHVLMLTTYDDESARVASVLAGAGGYVLKQIRGDELVTALRRVARGERVQTEAACGFDAIRGQVGDERLRGLTPQERRVLDLVAEGRTNRQIGEQMGIAEKTVRNHVSHVLAKLGLERRTQAALYVVRNSSTDRRGPA